MKHIMTGSLVFGLLIMLAVSGFAQDQNNDQELPKAKKMENHTWHHIELVKFKPGSMDKAMDIIDNHFMKAGVEVGMEGPMIMKLRSGEWDAMFIWKMDDISDLNWEVSPESEKFYSKMAEQEGGGDKAKAVMDEYMNYIQDWTSYWAVSQNREEQQAQAQE